MFRARIAVPTLHLFNPDNIFFGRSLLQSNTCLTRQLTEKDVYGFLLDFLTSTRNRSSMIQFTIPNKRIFLLKNFGSLQARKKMMKNGLSVTHQLYLHKSASKKRLKWQEHNCTFILPLQ